LEKECGWGGIMELNKIEKIKWDARKMEKGISKDASREELSGYTQAFVATKYFLEERGLINEFKEYYQDYKSSWEKYMIDMIT
jgi:hypothetical protein